MPSAKYAFSLSSLRFSNGNTAIDLSHLWADTRGRRKNPAAAETATPGSTSITMFRRRCDLGPAGVGVTRTPCAVISYAQARISAIGKPISSSTITRRSAQFGNSHAENAAEANWIMPPAAMIYAAATWYTLRRFTSSKKPVMAADLSVETISQRPTALTHELAAAFT